MTADGNKIQEPKSACADILCPPLLPDSQIVLIGVSFGIALYCLISHAHPVSQAFISVVTDYSDTLHSQYAHSLPG